MQETPFPADQCNVPLGEQAREGHISCLSEHWAGPGLLTFVVDKLVQRVNAGLPASRSYAVLHADSGDARGIDVAFIYDDTLFEVPSPPDKSYQSLLLSNRFLTTAMILPLDHG